MYQPSSNSKKGLKVSQCHREWGSCCSCHISHGRLSEHRLENQHVKMVVVDPSVSVVNFYKCCISKNRLHRQSNCLEVSWDKNELESWLNGMARTLKFFMSNFVWFCGGTQKKTGKAAIKQKTAFARAKRLKFEYGRSNKDAKRQTGTKINCHREKNVSS